MDLFFVLSGFLISGILLDSPKDRGYFKNFYARRILRLFPVYYCYLLLLMIALPWLHHAGHTSMQDYTGNWWWYLTYFCNWKANFAASDPYLGHFWSLAVEEQFYLVWPTILFLVPRRYLALVCAALILSAGILRGVWSHEGVYWNQIYRFTITRWDTMCCGALAALAFRSPFWRPLMKRIAPALMVCGLGGLLSIALWQRTILWENAAIQVYGATLAAVGFTGLVAYAASAQSCILYGWLQKPLLLSLGRYSYTIYVIHVVIVDHFEWLGSYVFHKGWLPAPPVQVAVVALSFLASYWIAALSWRFFESPVLQLKRRFV